MPDKARVDLQWQVFIEDATSLINTIKREGYDSPSARNEANAAVASLDRYIEMHDEYVRSHDFESD